MEVAGEDVGDRQRVGADGRGVGVGVTPHEAASHAVGVDAAVSGAAVVHGSAGRVSIPGAVALGVERQVSVNGDRHRYSL